VPASITDPFLRHLLAGADVRTIKEVADGCKQLEKEQSEVEQLLVARASSTKRQLTHLLKLIEQHHHQKQEDTAHGEQQQQIVRLQAQVNHLVAQHRTLTAQLQASDDRWLEGQEQIKKLQNELADAEQELSNAQRKLFTIKSSNDMAAKEAPATPAAARAGSGTLATTAATPAPPAPVQADMAEELQEVQQLLQKRTAELDKERELHVKTSRELQEALARVTDEGLWVHNTRKYQAVVAEVDRLQELLAAQGRDVEAALRERDLADARAADKAGCAQREVQLLARLREQEVRWHSLATAKADVERARDELELQLQQERSRLGNHQTVAELHAMISSLKTVIELKEQEARLAKVPQSQVDAAALEVARARSALEAAEQQLARQRQTMAQHSADMEAAQAQEAAAKARVLDLQAFVDVLTVYCSDTRDAMELRISESTLRARIAELESALEGHELRARLAALEEKERQARSRADAAASEADLARRECSAAAQRVKDLGAQLAQARSECELYISEIETTSTAYDEMQVQNTRLLGQLTEKDEANNVLLAERIKVRHAQSRLEDALEAARADAQRLMQEVAGLRQAREEADAEAARMASEMVSVKEQMRAHAARVASLEQEVQRHEEAAASLNTQLQTAQKQLAQQQDSLAQAEERSNKDRSKRQRLEEESKSLASRVEKLRRANSGGAGGASGETVRELSEEVEAMRKLLNCNVCHERQKNVIITKCCHVFCEKCISKNLEARNRKCPGCGVGFGQADVKRFFYT